MSINTNELREGITEGPWFYTAPSLDSRGHGELGGIVGVLTAGSRSEWEECAGVEPSEADLMLMAAAPELLDEIDRLRALLREGLSAHGRTPRESVEKWHAWAARASAALPRD